MEEMKNLFSKERYAPKEIQVYEGVLSLLGAGKNLHELKVCDIAAAAGIGKGTVYEYFKSKEEIIEKAAIYKFSVEFARTEEVLAAGLCFQDTLDRLLDIAAAVFDREAPSLWTLARMAMSRRDGGCAVPDGLPQCIAERVTQVCDALLEVGVREGALPAQGDAAYSRFAIRAAFSAFVELRGQGPCAARDAAFAKDNARKLLLRALG